MYDTTQQADQQDASYYQRQASLGWQMSCRYGCYGAEGREMQLLCQNMARESYEKARFLMRTVD